MITTVRVMVSGECVAFSAVQPRIPGSYIRTDDLGRIISVMRRLGHDDISIIARDEFDALVDVEWYVNLDELLVIYNDNEEV